MSVTPRRLAAEAARLMRAAGDPATAGQSRSYFKPNDRVRFHGINAPRLREIERELFSRVKGAWGIHDSIAFARLCVANPFNESKTVGILLLSRYHREFERGLLSEVEGWLARNQCDNWSVVDALAPWVITPLLRRHPSLVARVRRWNRSRNLWLRRASVVCFVSMARHGEHLETAYDTAVVLRNDGEDLMHKAVGWLLREAGRTDASRLESFLLLHGPTLPRTTVRYAIERFPAPSRKRLLTQTRGGETRVSISS